MNPAPPVTSALSATFVVEPEGIDAAPQTKQVGRSLVRASFQGTPGSRTEPGYREMILWREGAWRTPVLFVNQAEHWERILIVNQEGRTLARQAFQTQPSINF
jgi:hypothetical protein